MLDNMKNVLFFGKVAQERVKKNFFLPFPKMKKKLRNQNEFRSVSKNEKKSSKYIANFFFFRVEERGYLTPSPKE